MALLSAAALRRSAASLRRCFLLVAAAAALVAATTSTSITPPPPPPPPVSSSSSSSAAGAAAASNSPPAASNDSAPPPLHGSNIYRDGLYAAFNSLSDYTLMSKLFQDMDLSWMDPALPCTLLVVRDIAGFQPFLNVNNLGTLLAGPFQIQLFPARALTLSDFTQMTAGGQWVAVQTMMANRTVLVTRSDKLTYAAASGGGPLIFLDRVPIVNPDVFVAPDGQLVAHGILFPLPSTNIPPPGKNAASALLYPFPLHIILFFPTLLLLLIS